MKMINVFCQLLFMHKLSFITFHSENNSYRGGKVNVVTIENGNFAEQWYGTKTTLVVQSNFSTGQYQCDIILRPKSFVFRLTNNKNN